MKKAKYQTFIQLQNQIFLHYNSFSDKYLLMDKDCHDKYQNEDIPSVLEKNENLYKKLVESKYYIEDEVNELDIILYKRLSQKMDSTIYHIVINTTLDCNLRCWYCYENKSKGSELKENIISAIKKKHIFTLRAKAIRNTKNFIFRRRTFYEFSSNKRYTFFFQIFLPTKEY